MNGGVKRVIGRLIFAIILLSAGLTIGLSIGQSNNATISDTGIHNFPWVNGTSFRFDDELWYGIPPLNRTDVLQYPEQSASYVIFKSGSTIYAKNGATGQIEFSGTDAATVIQAAINALTSGGIVYIKQGKYSIEKTINITMSSIALEGSIGGSDIYEGGTILHGDGSTLLLNVSGPIGGEIEVVNIRYINFDGGASTKTVGAHNIHIGRATEVYIENCAIRRAGDIGVQIDGGVGEHTEIVWIGESDIAINQGDGVEIFNMNTVYIICCHINHNEIGVRTSNVNQVFVIASAIKRNERHGMYLGGKRFQIIGNAIVANDYSDTGTYNGIDLPNPRDVIIVGNNICDNDKYEISIGASANRVVIKNNDLYGTEREGVIFDAGGTDIRISDNIGFVTENSGSATIANGATSIAVDHGCDYTPAPGDIKVHPIEPLGSASYWYVDTITSSQFTIHVDTDPGQDVDFAWSVDRH